jgi:hypothetical protein
LFCADSTGSGNGDRLTTNGFVGAATNSSVAAKPYSMQPIKADLCVSLVRRQTALPTSKTGFIQMKLANHPISGDVAPFASLIAMEKELSAAESRMLIPADAFRRDSGSVQGQRRDGREPNIKKIRSCLTKRASGSQRKRNAHTKM